MCSLTDKASVFGGGADLSHAAVGGHLELGGAVFEAPLLMIRTRIGEDMSSVQRERDATIFKGRVDLTAAQVGGTILLDGSVFEGELAMGSLRVGRDLFMRRGEFAAEARFKAPVNISHAQIAGHVELDGATLEATLTMEGIQVGHTLRAVGTVFEGDVNIPGATVGGLLVITDATLKGRLDLSASRIGGQLRLGMPGRAARWGDGSKLDLRDTAAGSLQDAAEQHPERGWQSSWPSPGALQLDGFTYDRLGGFGVAQADEMVERPVDWYIHWLRMDEPYSPQPSEHLASVLRQAGHPEKANLILYASRERARERAGGLAADWSIRHPLRSLRRISRWIGLSLLKWSIGYGIGDRYFRAIVPALALTLFGIFMLGTGPVGQAGSARSTTLYDKLAYSFDELLPIMELDPAFSKVELPQGMVEYYFFFHRAVGFLLGSFIAAGIAGLTQRSRG